MTIGARTGRLGARARGLGPHLLRPLLHLGRHRAGTPGGRRGRSTRRRAHGCRCCGVLLHAARE
eukprot:11674272-Alexandrium_andersonii.AAC.1